ncbi:hypothetical protein [Paraburkholderia aspalathi]|jgi:hypothetical protein|uniref:hypothetical protein n=1 Tax=Paraburkholderia aspalathi TaxID=1324617 RepID=UPI001B104134|nr:hypothetical protein [Paraburkholderia aspalathi]CAE6846156.1 hypothetical protein R20943_07351 [Paraburkholderia aspalathi]
MKAPIRIDAALAAKIDYDAAANLVGASLADALLRLLHEMVAAQREAVNIAVVAGRLLAATPGTAWTVVSD